MKNVWRRFSSQAACKNHKKSYCVGKCTRCLDLNSMCNAGAMRNKKCEGSSQAGVSCDGPRLYRDKRAKDGEDAKIEDDGAEKQGDEVGDGAD